MKKIIVFLVWVICSSFCYGYSPQSSKQSSDPPLQETQFIKATASTVTSNDASQIPTLPTHTDTNRVCTIPVKSGDVSTASFTFISDTPFIATSVEYEILISKEFLLQSCLDDNNISLLLKLGYVRGTHENKQPVGEPNSSEFLICKENKGFLVKFPDGQSQPGIESNNYYKFKIKMAVPLKHLNTTEQVFLNLTQETRLSALDQTGTIHIDNVIFNDQNAKSLKCHFDNRYGRRTKENLMIDTYFNNSAMGYSHGLTSYLSQIGIKDNTSNFISVDVVMDGSVASNEYDANFSSLILAFKDSFQLAEELDVSCNLVIPKYFFKGLTKKSEVFIGLDLVIDGKERESTAGFLLRLDEQGKPICYKDDGSSYGIRTPKVNNPEIRIEEKTDCYVFFVRGKVKYDFPSAEEIWVKAKFSSNNCVYTGKWYYNNFSIKDKERTILKFDVSAKSSPYHLIELYSPTTNGIKYSHDKIIYGFSFIGFEKLNLDNK